MRLSCPICSHSWEEPVSTGRREAICPECVAKIPITKELLATAETQLLGSLDESAKSPAPRSELHHAETLIFPKGSEDSTAISKLHDGETLKLPPNQPAVHAPTAFEPFAGAETRHLSGSEPTRVTDPEPKPRAHTRDDIKRQHEELIGRTLNGYRIEKLLGAGGMGAVYLAHQIALDRKVALKVLPAHLANNFDLVARFTREALSAAQLNHHNIIQVYDVGTSGGVQYIVMEFVRGESLGQIIRRDGPLRVDDAAGYVLQAARGLHYAHERGIIHRDIKPDNLMLNEHGIVKIADMGLAKMRGTIEERYETSPAEAAHLAQITNVDLTLSNMALGTPAYMAPEQARDTASVDPRADQYSLGCTLYYLSAGKAPYSGTTAFELMSKHLKEPLIPIETHVRGVPPAFSEIIRRMLAKDPADRFPTLKDAAKAIEQYLGIDTESGPYKPREHHLAVLEDSQRDYYSAKSRKHRKMAVLAFYMLLPVLLVTVFVAPRLAGAALAAAVLVPIASIVINGIANRTYLYRRLRGLIFGMDWKAWLQFIGGALALGLVLVLTGWIWSWLAVLLVAIAVAAAYQTLILRPLRQQRSASIARMNDMIKELRLRGLAEEAVQDFICRFSGADWQEFFEEFFSYEDMLLARARMATADKVKSRHKWATWRDPIFRALDRVDEARRQRREKTALARAEKNRLKSQGMDEATAAKEADAEATRILKSGLVLVVPSEDHAVTVKRRIRVGGPIKVLYRVFRFVGGAAVAAAAVINYIGGMGAKLGVSGNLTPALDKYYSMGWGGYWAAIIAGIALLASSFSRRIFTPTLVLLGTLAIVFAAHITQVSAQTLLLSAGALIAIGIGYPLLSKLTGGKF